MNHWIIVPVVLPALAATVLVLLGDRLAWQRAIGLAATVALLAVAIGLALRANAGDCWTYALGDWPAPFGIVLVLDRLAALMLLLTAIVALGSLLHALNGCDARGRYFHALFQFQLMGLDGAFLTGDLFNLFVFFEVLLIASYGLLVHGGGAERFRAGAHYVVVNLTGSALFLVAVSLLYAMTGTLNMADMALKVAGAGAADAALIRAGALLLLVVFGVKAALVPLYFWLPATYSAAAAPVAALFAIMTKVGVYAILRVSTLIFGADAGIGSAVAQPWLLPAGLVTLALGTLGALAGRTLRRLIAYLTIASVGTILAGVGLFREAAVGAALYYMAHSTLAVALLFLVADLIARGRGAAADRLERAAAVPQPALLGSLYFVSAVALAGVPPLSGYLGKLLLLQAAQGEAAAVWVWSTVLACALLTLVALSRAGSALFWHVAPMEGSPQRGRATIADALPAAALLGCLLGLAAGAQPAARYARATAEQLLHPAGYVRAVLGGAAGLSAETAGRR